MTVRERAAEQQARATELLERHRHRPLVDLAIRWRERDREIAGTVLGSAVAFRLFLFFVPLLLLLVGVIGFVATRVDRGDVEEVTGVTGVIADQLGEALDQAGSTRWVAVIVGLVGVVTTGRTLSKVLVSASCLAWRLPVRAKATPRVVGTIVGLIVGVGLISVIVNRVREDLGVAVTGLSLLAAFALYVLAWLVLTAMLPRATPELGSLLPGAALMGVLLTAMQAVSQLYLPERFSTASALYGAIGTTVVVLGWFFILGRALVLAFVLDAVVEERFGGVAGFVFSLPLLRGLARRSARIRRWFDLEPRPVSGNHDTTT